VRGVPPPSVPGAVSLTFTTDLAEVRELVRSCSKDAGLSEKRAIDLVIAVGEVAANTVQHAQTAGTLDIWQDAGEIICQITDAGFISDPLAGSRAPAAGATEGYGLWMVNQVCDKVDIHSDETGTTIRMHMNLKDSLAGRRSAAAVEPDRGTLAGQQPGQHSLQSLRSAGACLDRTSFNEKHQVSRVVTRAPRSQSHTTDPLSHFFPQTRVLHTLAYALYGEVVVPPPPRVAECADRLPAWFSTMAQAAHQPLSAKRRLVLCRGRGADGVPSLPHHTPLVAEGRPVRPGPPVTWPGPFRALVQPQVDGGIFSCDQTLRCSAPKNGQSYSRGAMQCSLR
jgi:anti-sigma regulatory factor (Ser/Thr protein kinase)